MTYHQPVLLSEAVRLLDPSPNKTFLDATLGNGGHSYQLLKKGATVFGLDADQANLKLASSRLSQFKHFYPIHDNFVNLKSIHQHHIKRPLDGIIFDLGLSNNQITAQNRGFSFNDNLSLDMRLNPTHTHLTAQAIINTYDLNQLSEIFSKYGQEILAKPISASIINHRQHSPITTASRLAKIITDCYSQHHRRPTHHPATKVFLALKTVVNNEYNNLKDTLPQTINLLKPNGVTIIITFHSGEDRLVKLFIKSHHFFQSGTIYPSSKEIDHNPLSRSAILRWYKIC